MTLTRRRRAWCQARDSLDMCAHKLRSFIASHHRISADIRNLLKSILKHDDSTQNKALREYLVKYKVFIENVTELHGNVLSKDFTDVMVKRTIEQVGASLAVINEIYNDLFTFEKMLSSALTDGCRRMVRNHSENLSIDYPGSPIKKGLCLSTVAFRHIKVQQHWLLNLLFSLFLSSSSSWKQLQIIRNRRETLMQSQYGVGFGWSLKVVTLILINRPVFTNRLIGWYARLWIRTI